MFFFISELSSVIVDFFFLSWNCFNVRFFDPRSGEFSKVLSVTEKSVRRVISPPGEDLVLLIQSL
jgi:hypothetical protein